MKERGPQSKGEGRVPSWCSSLISLSCCPGPLEVQSEKMTIGRNSRKGSALSSVRAPKFLDKAAGFYCRLHEPNAREEGEEGEVEEGQREKVEDFSERGMGDDEETLLQRKTSRLSSRWRRSSRRKQREAEGDPAEKQGPRDIQAEAPSCQEVVIQVAAAEESAGAHGEPALVHFATQEEADDRVLIRHMKRGRDGEGEEERRAAREQEEGMKMVKRMTAKNYRKVSDSGKRSFRQRMSEPVFLSVHKFAQIPD